MTQGDYPRAFAQFLLASRADPTYAMAAFRVARTYADMGEAEHAMVAFRDLLASFEEDPLIHRMRFEFGRFLQETVKDPEAAIAEYTRIIDAFTEAALSPDDLIEEYFALRRPAQRGQPPAARRPVDDSGSICHQRDILRARDRVGQQRSMLRRALFQRGQTYRTLGETLRAFRDVYLAMALYPDFILSADEELVGVGSALRVYYYEASVARRPRIPAAALDPSVRV